MLGVDIGACSLKLVQGVRPGIVENDHRFAYEEQLEGRTLEPVREQLWALIRANGYKEQPVWGSVSSVYAKTHIAEFPRMSEDELKGAVELEAGEYASSDWGEVDVDYQVLEEVADDQLRVLLVVCPRSLTEEYIRLFRECSLYPVGLTIDAVSIVTTFQSAFPSHQRAVRWAVLVDIGARRTNIDVVEGDMLQIVRNVDFGENTLRENAGAAEEESASDDLKVTEENFEQLLTPLITELERTIEYYRRMLRQRGDAGAGEDFQLFICGGGASLTRIVDVLTGRIQKDVQVLDPFQNMQVNTAAADESAVERSVYAVAVGNLICGLS